MPRNVFLTVNNVHLSAHAQALLRIKVARGKFCMHFEARKPRAHAVLRN